MPLFGLGFRQLKLLVKDNSCRAYRRPMELADVQPQVALQGCFPTTPKGLAQDLGILG